MNRLSTELDDKILQLLDQQDLSVMSQTNKYYRQISERIMYRDLKLCWFRPLLMIKLFIVILRRPEAAVLVHSVSLLAICKMPMCVITYGGLTNELKALVWNNTGVLKQNIDALTSGNPISVAISRMRDFLDLERSFVFGTCFAMILLMASNLGEVVDEDRSIITHVGRVKRFLQERGTERQSGHWQIAVPSSKSRLAITKSQEDNLERGSLLPLVDNWCVS